ncbi:MAG: hypothetical protein U5P10_03440 [Spirochaetia bacterium]|nr:hypothetical protein [Spirochaetia bacterium]
MAGIVDLMKEHVYGLFDIPYVPEEILTAARPLVLHISDTPKHLRAELFERLSRETGDKLLALESQLSE